ncbi:MAG: hypothetical protein HY320_11235 [Armatimonadetes bacterium]|nr:hypothetical protein [Armatimonadota bacterium]
MICPKALGIALAAAGLSIWTLAGCSMPSAPADFQPGQPSTDAGHVHNQAPPEAPPSRSKVESSDQQHLGSLMVTVPRGWKVGQADGQFRVAVYQLPRVAPDKVDAELVVTAFAGGVGSVEANIERWRGMFEPAGGGSSGVEPKVRTLTVDGMKATRADLSGTYVGPKGPMMGETAHEPGWRMLVAFVEAPDGPYVFKLLGPQRTVGKWEQSFDTYLGSIKKGA